MTDYRDPHLSGESLLLFMSGELTDAERQLADDHLASCEQCRGRLEETGTLVGDLRQTADRLDFHHFSARLDSVHRRSGFLSRLSRLSMATGSAAAALVVGLLVWNTSVPSVSATELLHRAVREESQQTRRVGYVRVRDGRGECALSPGKVQTVSSKLSCERMRSQLESVSWDWQNPLSARSFDRWRSSLANKRDSVTRETGSFSLRTSASSGVLRAATLRVRTSDFHPMTMRLEFEESAPVEISEETSPERTSETLTSVLPEASAVPELASLPASMPPANPPIEDPAAHLDAAEIQVRVALHETHADLGYETIVRRGPDGLEVFGLVRDAGRQAELTAALAGIPNLRVAIKTYAVFQPGDDSAFPKGEQGNTLPPLASKWLKSTWPDQEQSAAFVNRVGQLASALLGEATVLQELTVRCDVLKGNPGISGLLLVRQDHERHVADLLSLLRGSLQPLTGVVGEPASITFEQARALQSAIVRLFSACRPDAGSLDDEIARLRSVYGAAK